MATFYGFPVTSEPPSDMATSCPSTIAPGKRHYDVYLPECESEARRRACLASILHGALG